MLGTLDHVIVGVADLEAGIGRLAKLTGVTPVRGGRHPGRGTQNALLSLGPHTYLEIMAPAPAMPEAPDTSFLAGLEKPTPIGWAIDSRDLDATVGRLRAAGWRITDPRAGSRVRPDGEVLRWRTADLADAPGDLTPFLIEWSAATTHPATSSPSGCTLESLEIHGPAAERLARLVRELGLESGTVRDQPAFVWAAGEGSPALLVFTLNCPTGRVTLPAPDGRP